MALPPPPGGQCGDMMPEVAGCLWKSWNLSGLGNQEMEAREIVAAEESGEITEGKEPRRIPNSDYLYLSVTPRTICLQNRLIVIQLKKKYMNRHRNTGTATQETELVVLIRGGKRQNQEFP